MTPEVAAYHRAMLMVGLRDRFDQDFDDALENESPLSDLILELSTCVSDTEQVMSILHTYVISNNADDKAVYALIIDDIRNRYLKKELTRNQVVSILFSIVQNLDEYRIDPWTEITYLSCALEMLEDKLISEEVFNTYFDVWLFQGKQLDLWKLHCQLEGTAKKKTHSKVYWRNLTATISFMLLAVITIVITVILTGSRDMSDFTKTDWSIWSIFLITELTLWALAFFFAGRCGKVWKQENAYKLSILEKHKRTGLSMYGEHEQVVFDYQATRRAVAFKDGDSYSVTIEWFDSENLRWYAVDHEDGLESLDAVREFLENEQDFIISD